jgi:hypothetical protein
VTETELFFSCVVKYSVVVTATTSTVIVRTSWEGRPFLGSWEILGSPLGPKEPLLEYDVLNISFPYGYLIFLSEHVGQQSLTRKIISLLSYVLFVVQYVEQV